MVIQQDFIHRLKNLSTCLVYEKLKDYSCVEYHAIHTHIIRYHPGGGGGIPYISQSFW